MSRNLIETVMGAVVLGVAGYFFVTTYQNSGLNTGEESYRLTAEFSDVTGVTIGSDVRIGGVKVGSVQSISLNRETYQAQIHMLVNKDIALPLDTTAAITGESLLGGKFVALSAGGDETMLPEGGVIEFTQSSVSLEQLLGKFVFSGGGVSEGGDTPSVEDKDDNVELTLP